MMMMWCPVRAIICLDSNAGWSKDGMMTKQNDMEEIQTKPSSSTLHQISFMSPDTDSSQYVSIWAVQNL